MLLDAVGAGIEHHRAVEGVLHVGDNGFNGAGDGGVVKGGGIFSLGNLTEGLAGGGVVGRQLHHHEVGDPVFRDAFEAGHIGALVTVHQGGGADGVFLADGAGVTVGDGIHHGVVAARLGAVGDRGADPDDVETGEGIGGILRLKLLQGEVIARCHG